MSPQNLILDPKNARSLRFVYVGLDKQESVNHYGMGGAGGGDWLRGADFGRDILVRYYGGTSFWG